MTDSAADQDNVFNEANVSAATDLFWWRDLPPKVEKPRKKPKRFKFNPRSREVRRLSRMRR